MRVIGLSRQIHNSIEFVGAKTARLFAAAVLVGICWFFVEASFVYVMQIFLVAIGLIERTKTILPDNLEISHLTGTLALIGFGIFRSAVNFCRIYVSGVTNQSFVRFQRSIVLKRSLRSGAAVSSHQLATLFNETITHSGLFLMKMSEFTISVTSLTFFFFMGFYLAPYELLVSITALAILVYPLKAFNRQIHEAGKGLQSEYATVNRTLLVSLRNRFFLDIVGQTETYLKSGLENLKRYEEHYRQFYRIFGIKALAPNLLGVLIISGVTLLSLRYFHTEPIKLLGFFYVFLRLAQGASDASSTMSDFRLHVHAFKRLREINLSGFDGEGGRLKQRPPATTCEEINFDRVSFSYGAKPILLDLSFSLKAGDRILIQGPSGSGKSTLVLLLSGLLRPTLGKVTVDGRDSESLDLTGLISYAGPEPFLIDDTVRANLLFGVDRDEVADSEMIEALKKAEVWDVVSSFPEGLDFALNEQAQLSTGQKQRIALARLILRGGKILIFDEATSNIDYGTEQRILSNLMPDFKDRLVVFISHRDSLKSYVTKEIQLEGPSGGEVLP